MVGNPCYQITSAMDYQMEFNNQNEADEINSKLLLMLPMVPMGHVEKVLLNHMKLTGQETSSKQQFGKSGLTSKKDSITNTLTISNITKSNIEKSQLSPRDKGRVNSKPSPMHSNLEK